MLGDQAVAAVGCDVQAVDEVASAISHFGDRYLDRVYTGAEQAESASAASLAARFAAKEAVLKLIGRADGIDPRSVEVLRSPAGRPQVRLHGSAAAAHAASGVGTIDVSLSHAAGLAFAVAAATRAARTSPAASAAAGPLPSRSAEPPPPRPRPQRPQRQVNDVTGTTRLDDIRSILAEHGRLSVDAATLTDTDNLYAAGLTSHAAVTVMLALEDAFDTEFTEELLTKGTFASVATITAALATLGVDVQGGVPC